ncbi:hypothetical protein ALC56_14475 [Trachymyrmex septentrionalis]|uniref:Uncharacterized protein n=1 Tax=Trachymyrmex septentrionalis TaxID=34720 RepID=A0A195ETH2_9HYME|nr:hypothetical protein ALC56_14475 [Trachymyrmex septentrionalis]
MQEDLIIYCTAAASSRYLNSVDISTNTERTDLRGSICGLDHLPNGVLTTWDDF